MVRAIETNGKKDIRCKKTDSALDGAMWELLRQRNFRKITVNDICAAALTSRATFYTRYTDKYDFLKSWLARVGPQNLTCNEPYEKIEKTINELVFENKPVIKNIVNDADQETLDILLQRVLSFLDLAAESGKLGASPKQIILHNIGAGGIVNYIFWQVKHNFPADVKPMNEYLYEIIKCCQNIKPE